MKSYRTIRTVEILVLFFSLSSLLGHEKMLFICSLCQYLPKKTFILQDLLIHNKLTKNVDFFFSAKDDSKSPVRGGGGRISVTAPPSRKPSATNNVSNLSSIFIPRQENNDWVVIVF